MTTTGKPMLPESLQGENLLSLWETLRMPHLSTWVAELRRAYPEADITFDDVYQTIRAAIAPIEIGQYRAWRLANPDANRPDPGAMIEKFIDLAQRMNDERDRIDPIYTHKEITIPTGRSGGVAILMAGCFHFGGRYTMHRWAMDRIDDAFRIPNVYLAFFGDSREGFYPRFRDEQTVIQQALNPDLQDDMMLWVYQKFAPKLLWEVSSQHGNEWDEKRGAGNQIKQLCLMYDAVYFDGTGYVRLNIGDQSYYVAVGHKFPGTSYHNPNHAQWRAFFNRFGRADVVAQADKHQIAWQFRQVHQDEVQFNNRESADLWLIQIGTAKGGPDPYTIRGWPKGQLGWPLVWFSATDHRVKITLDIEDILRWCE